MLRIAEHNASAVSHRSYALALRSSTRTEIASTTNSPAFRVPKNLPLHIPSQISSLAILTRYIMVNDSTLQKWYDHDPRSFETWNTFHSNTKLDPCVYGNGTIVACSKVCNDTRFLLDPEWPQNLNTCGIWAYYVSGTKFIAAHGPNGTFIDVYQGLGLKGNDYEFATAVQGKIADCMNEVDYGLPTGYNTDYSKCNRDTIFGGWPRPGPSYGFGATIRPCLDDICSPKTLNPDVGGIGVCGFRLR